MILSVLLVLVKGFLIIFQMVLPDGEVSGPMSRAAANADEIQGRQLTNRIEAFMRQREQSVVVAYAGSGPERVQNQWWLNALD